MVRSGVWGDIYSMFSALGAKSLMAWVEKSDVKVNLLHSKLKRGKMEMIQALYYKLRRID
jgi:hypothetical protein